MRGIMSALTIDGKNNNNNNKQIGGWWLA